MGTQSGADLDAWLRAGGLVVASSDRAARATQAEFHRRRRAEGLAVWPSPNVVDWKSFLRNGWEERALDSRLPLNPVQEQQIWSDVIRSDEHLALTLPASTRRLAGMAMEAHNLLCSYASKYLHESARVGWDQDTGAFSAWLAEFDQYCRKNQLISLSRLPLELIPVLQKDSSSRPELRVAGFDRMLPIQKEIFDSWGIWEQIQPESTAAQISFHSARDGQTELETCAWWCYRQLEKYPDARFLVVTQDIAQRRGEIERAFLRFNPPAAFPLFELSLGLPVNQVPPARSALLLLRWLSSTLSENELDWLLSSGIAGSPDETAALQAGMRKVRARDRQRVEWTLESLLKEMTGDAAPPPQWARRLSQARLALRGYEQLQSHIDWADKVPRLLEAMGWPGIQSQSSADFQAERRWQQALDAVGSLGFGGRKIPWRDFLTELENAAGETLFAPESTDAPIQIAGPAESAGLSANAIWFLGADEDAWPAVGSMHPFLPPHVQRETAMPHSSHAHDWEFSAAITRRLIASAPEVHFSYAGQKDDVETRPSRLVRQIAGEPRPLPATLLPPVHEPPLAGEYHDSSTVPFRANQLRGGAGVLSSQAQCPFKAFAGARLAAQDWDAAEAGLSAKQRGQLLHDVLRSVWSGQPRGIRSLTELKAVDDLETFVRDHVRKTLAQKTPPAVRELMPPLYLTLEETRLVRLVMEWLDYERGRADFTVEETETAHTTSIARLTMNLRLDRVDRLGDASQLVIDYKTGTVDPRSWDLPRPDDVQLPLYKIFAITPVQPSLFESHGGPPRGGLVFAKVRIGDACFAGRVTDALATLKPDLSASSALVKQKLTAAQESEWKEYIEQLATDFIHGRADVDPRDYPKTCERCGLQSICRIQDPQNRARFEDQEAGDDNAAED